MSLRASLLNRWLRMVEKPRIRRADHPAPLRRALEFQSKLMFHPPRGTKKRWVELGSRNALEVTPEGAEASSKVIFYIHGGGFTFGSPRTHAAMVAQLANRVGARGLLPSYGLAPENPFPAAPDDVRAAWDGLIGQGVSPSDVIIGGDSAGGALAFGLLTQLCAEKAGLPAGVFGFSPLTDMTHAGASFTQNAQSDVLLVADKAADMNRMFLGNHSPKEPRVSPLFGGFKGAPPVWITVGDTEILLDDARSLAQLCEEHGVSTTLVERRDLPHVWPIFHNMLPEARETLDQLADWIKQQPGWQGES